MSEPSPSGIKVRICDVFGFYLVESDGAYDFTRNKAEANVFDYHADQVVDLVIHAAKNLETQWFLDPVDDNLKAERCDKCGFKQAVTDMIFTGKEVLCEECVVPEKQSIDAKADE